MSQDEVSVEQMVREILMTAYRENGSSGSAVIMAAGRPVTNHDAIHLKAIEAAILAERERCAEIVDAYSAIEQETANQAICWNAAETIARLIRSSTALKASGS